MNALLTPPEVPPEQRATAEFSLRYDDVDQDGRVQCASAAHALGPGVWRPIYLKSAVGTWCRKNMILPILSRLVVERGEGPVAVRMPLAVEGTMALGHVPGPGPGSVDRIILSMWITLDGEIGETNLPPPANAGTPIRVARVYAEHVLSAPFAPPAERKVRRLGGEGVEPVPSRVYEAPPMSGYGEPPERAVPLGDRVDDPPFLFGLSHTDPNRHVNSLVYPRLFEEAAVRRLAAIGETQPRLARTLELGFRRPFFAGERARISLQAFRDDEGLGVSGTFYPADEDPANARPSTWARVRF